MELSQTFYWSVGVLVVANVGTMLSVLVLGFKGAWWLSKLDSRVEQHAEHIDEIKERVNHLGDLIYKT